MGLLPIFCWYYLWTELYSTQLWCTPALDQCHTFCTMLYTIS